MGEIKQSSGSDIFVHNNYLAVEVQGRIQEMGGGGGGADMKQSSSRSDLFVHNNRLVVEVKGRIQGVRTGGDVQRGGGRRPSQGQGPCADDAGVLLQEPLYPGHRVVRHDASGCSTCRQWTVI